MLNGPTGEAGGRRRLGLAGDAVTVAIEPMRVGPLHPERSLRDIPAVEIRRRWRDAAVRVGGKAIATWP